MHPVPIQPGVYQIHSHLPGPGLVVTATEHAIMHGAPVIVEPRLLPPFEQQWAIEAAQAVPGSPYVMHLALQELAGIVTAEEKIYVNNVARAEWSKVTFEPVIGGVRIVAESGLVCAVQHRGQQVQLVKPDTPDYSDIWTLEFIRPLDEG